MSRKGAEYMVVEVGLRNKQTSNEGARMARESNHVISKVTGRGFVESIPISVLELYFLRSE